MELTHASVISCSWLQESISEAQKAVEDLAEKLEELDWDVQQERASAQSIMDTLLLGDIHIKRLAELPVRQLRHRTPIVPL